MRLDLDVSSNQKDNICDFSVQAGQEEVSESCNENTVDFLTEFVPDDLEKEKERLKEELFNLKLNFRKWNRKTKNLKMKIFVTNYCLLIKITIWAFQM